eukprot:TRINITY_DN11179_c1_g1_i1.p1 TRINITY_DN11179_c1_g1~~TRINITY_DN11179_c1_g1_i1.p1  ORF type:complete len:101 (+),score=5.26 TRINITY_DN11179_c1_g1_i1:886-1188(+)
MEYPVLVVRKERERERGDGGSATVGSMMFFFIVLMSSSSSRLFSLFFSFFVCLFVAFFVLRGCPSRRVSLVQHIAWPVQHTACMLAGVYDFKTLHCFAFF